MHVVYVDRLLIDLEGTSMSSLKYSEFQSWEQKTKTVEEPRLCGDWHIVEDKCIS